MHAGGCRLQGCEVVRWLHLSVAVSLGSRQARAVLVLFQALRQVTRKEMVSPKGAVKDCHLLVAGSFVLAALLALVFEIGKSTTT